MWQVPVSVFVIGMLLLDCLIPQMESIKEIKTKGVSHLPRKSFQINQNLGNKNKWASMFDSTFVSKVFHFYNFTKAVIKFTTHYVDRPLQN